MSKESNEKIEQNEQSAAALELSEQELNAVAGGGAAVKPPPPPPPPPCRCQDMPGKSW